MHSFATVLSAGRSTRISALRGRTPAGHLEEQPGPWATGWFWGLLADLRVGGLEKSLRLPRCRGVHGLRRLFLVSPNPGAVQRDHCSSPMAMPRSQVNMMTLSPWRGTRSGWFSAAVMPMMSSCRSQREPSLNSSGRCRLHHDRCLRTGALTELLPSCFAGLHAARGPVGGFFSTEEDGIVLAKSGSQRTWSVRGSRPPVLRLGSDPGQEGRW